MNTGILRIALITLCVAAAAMFVSAVRSGSFAQSQSSEAQDKTRARRTDAPAPSPTPPSDPKEGIPGESDEVVRVETNLTNLFFTAADSNKRFISNLTKEDIRVLEDGQPQQIFTFQQNIDLPLSIAILIDTSQSEERTLPDEKAAARSFLEAVMRPARDEAAIVSFTGEVTLEQGFTGNMDRLRQAIDRVEFVPPSGYIGGGVVVDNRPRTPPISDTNQILAGSTALWDAVWASSNDLLADSAENTRRAIILLTDGVDTISQVKMHDAVERAQKADALVYAIGIGDSYFGGVDTGSLKKIAERTGGRAYFPRSERELRAAFAQIQRDLREQYLVAYSPSNKARDGSYRKIQIEVVNPEFAPQKLKLNYRPGYFAKTATADNTVKRRSQP
ncbi:MAG TPA: VWA domain-containing protein [Pyrinomonadaceae bacterium]|nr:VWA domain-containing protein [Pyrinomonadaceae bacterium]